jgi:hypothetical protein
MGYIGGNCAGDIEELAGKSDPDEKNNGSIFEYRDAVSSLVFLIVNVQHYLFKPNMSALGQIIDSSYE